MKLRIDPMADALYLRLDDWSIDLVNLRKSNTVLQHEVIYESRLLFAEREAMLNARGIRRLRSRFSYR